MSSGRGKLFILDHLADDRAHPFQLIRSYQWPGDGLFDVTWSELNASIVWTGSADGRLLVYDLDDSRPEPIIVIKGHEKEIYNLEWNQVRIDAPAVLTCSRDTSIRIWDAHQGTCLVDLVEAHTCNAIVYAAVWSPRMSATFASVGGDGKLMVWSTRHLSPNTRRQRPGLIINASQTELLSCDWSKYCEWLLVTGSVDGLITGWDIRWPEAPTFTLSGHERAVKKLKCSPFNANAIASASYDLTTRLWNIGAGNIGATASPLEATFQNHSEFVYGLDFNVHANNLLVDCGWDESVVVFCPLPSTTPSTTPR